jgi:hypothetical protein
MVTMVLISRNARNHILRTLPPRQWHHRVPSPWQIVHFFRPIRRPMGVPYTP